MHLTCERYLRSLEQTPHWEKNLQPSGSGSHSLREENTFFSPLGGDKPSYVRSPELHPSPLSRQVPSYELCVPPHLLLLANAAESHFLCLQKAQMKNDVLTHWWAFTGRVPLLCWCHQRRITCLQKHLHQDLENWFWWPMSYVLKVYKVVLCIHFFFFF